MRSPRSLVRRSEPEPEPEPRRRRRPGSKVIAPVAALAVGIAAYMHRRSRSKRAA